MADKTLEKIDVNEYLSELRSAFLTGKEDVNMNEAIKNIYRFRCIASNNLSFSCVCEMLQNGYNLLECIDNNRLDRYDKELVRMLRSELVSFVQITYRTTFGNMSAEQIQQKLKNLTKKLMLKFIAIENGLYDKDFCKN